MKRVIAVSLCVIMLLALCACGAADNSAYANTTWALSSINAGGVEMTAEDFETYGISGSLSFTDKEFTIIVAEQTIAIGTYAARGDKITMTVDGDDAVATVDGDTITFEQDGENMTFTKK